MRHILPAILSLVLFAACTVATPAPPPTPIPTPLPSTPTPLPPPTPTPASEWGVAFAILAPVIVEAEGSIEGNLPSSLYLIRSDGSGLTRLTGEIEYITDLTASPDGRYLLFSAIREDTTGDGFLGRGDLAHLYYVDVQSGEIYTLTSGVEFTEWWGGSWSPDGGHIAFAAQEANARSEFKIEAPYHYHLCVTNRDSTGRKCLLERDSVIWNVAWSPSGEQILFEQGGAIWLVRPDGSGLFKLADTPVKRPFTAQPVWSPNGKRIAFAAPGVGEETDIFIINADGSGLLNLTQHPAEDFHPTWSPDGRYVAFVTARQGRWDIYVVENNGSALVPLFSSPAAGAYRPIWSPDGSQIAFVAKSGWWDQLFVVNWLDGSSRWLGDYIWDRPAWVLVPVR